MRRILLALTVTIAAVLFVGATAVAQSPPKVKIAEKTAPIDETFLSRVLVTVKYSCEPGAANGITVFVGQPAFPGAEGESPFGFGSTALECTGRWETVVVEVDEATGDPFTPFVPGAAEFTAELVGPSGSSVDVDTRKGQIVQ
jgi:hypothetical protein